MEVNNGESLTQPDETLSVRDIIRNHTRGLEVPALPGFRDDPEDIDLSDFDQMDSFQKEMYLRDNASAIERLKSELDEARDSLEAEPPTGGDPADPATPDS